MAWVHPQPSTIQLMPLARKPRKVWRHFYNPAEHWERLVAPQDPQQLAVAVDSIAGLNHRTQRKLSFLPPNIWHQAGPLLRQHHDNLYGPAYHKELWSPRTCWAPFERRSLGKRYIALTPQSVYIIVQSGAPDWVVTAYRPHPESSYVDWDELDIRDYAELKFERETGMSVSNFAQLIARKLEKSAASIPQTIPELWRLASAIGYGRLLQANPDVSVQLPAAEKTLGSVPKQLVEALEKTLLWEETLDQLAEALKEERPEELEAVLSSSEDLLAIAPVIGAEVRASTFLTAAEGLLTFLPAEWAYLEEEANRRQELLGSAGSLIGEFWESIAEAVTAALIRETEPAVRPVAKLVDKLLPAPQPWERWQTQIRGLALRAKSSIGQLATQYIQGFYLTEPTPTMGAENHATNEPWELRGSFEGKVPHQRIFIIDQANPAGHEVTELWEEEGKLSYFEHPGQEVFIVLFISETTLQEETFGELLEAAKFRDDIAVEGQVFIRSK